ncbi:MAG TPA: TIGR03668 family PPOX class F420-dependent oxidoreductase [Nocardioidaceae bacterium]|nr:TIGR03668 family PPOX class F420-dependent oxidoreductase [Nocardioidaceae bacterium]
MRLEGDVCRARVRSERVARLATTGADMRPHLVPMTFALSGDVVVSAVDQKPKRTTDLRRLRNIEDNPRVALLWDLYDDDWRRLWWVRGDGRAEVVHTGDRWHAAVEALRERYAQYRERPPRGPAVLVTVESWSGWSFAAADD